MVLNQDQQYNAVPPIPTYDEAVAGGSAWHHDIAHSPIEVSRPITEAEAEGQSLLTNPRHAFESSNTNSQHPRGRAPRGYRPPTVETDDESNLFSSDADSDSDDEREADQVRREMQELEIDDSNASGRSRSSWGKRIGLSLSLPQWRWKWKWRLPGLPRRRNGSGSGSGANDQTPSRTQEGQAPEPWLFQPPSLPTFGSAALFLLVGRVLAAVLVLGFLYLLFASDLFSNMARRMGSQMFDPESVRIHVQGSVDPRRIRDHLRHFTAYAHLAGTEGDFALMEDTEMLFRKYGLEDVTRDVYEVYLNYPKAGGRAVEILGVDGKATWSARLEEEDAGGRTTGHQTYVFHGHSKSGVVQGPLVYANYGSREDFQTLKDLGIDTKGAIALVRHYGSLDDIALKVKAAEVAGFAGCLIYNDPADNGFLKGTTAPEGRFMPADGVHRGTVSLMRWVAGDVLTPGWGSKPNMPRMKVDQTKGLVRIPSLPLAYRDAQILLQHLKGIGSKVPKQWVGGVPEIDEWWTGSSFSPIVRLKNEQDEIEKQPIWNVYGRITGIEQGEKKVIIGNHRDSWAFGAAGPHSGTAVMMEIIRVLGDLVARGWRPLRTIEFASWDGKEYNLIGSTEYVEQNDEALRQDALAYINLDTAVTGDTFHAAGSPVFRKLLLQVLNRVADPHYNTTLRNLWDRRGADLESLGADSDYVGFQDIVGTSSLDLRFEGDRHPSHSSYENFEWMETVGDPGFVYHTLLGQMLGLLILELADRPILPFDMTSYADKLTHWVTDLETWAAKQAKDQPLSLDTLRKAASDAAETLRVISRWELEWEKKVLSTSGWESPGLGRQRCEYNTGMAKFETDLLDEAGIPGRTQFKHVIFGPLLWSDDTEAYFPSIRDTVFSGNWTLAQLTVDRVAGVLNQAAANLGK
ncbi:Zn-dependent exopeptidase [Parathielavia appendiculata]|uniref:Zn-dependent exopeptidase n=1 Tax=Parathielavia appendiculata TaxID=2587402 RepID=A0AAN6U3S4_9PEZI|nr:Zn-dependent exopeptidase [Parathielavia appendiculata]